MSLLCWGPKLNTLSRCGLRSTTRRGTTPSLSLWVISLFTQPKRLLTAFAARAHCALKFSSLPSTTLTPFPQSCYLAPLFSACPIAGNLPIPLVFAFADFHGVPVSPFLQIPVALPQGMLSCMTTDCYCEETYGNIIVHVRVPRLTVRINSKSKSLWINIRSTHNAIKLFTIIVFL